MGFQAYIKFYETMQGSAKNKTHDDFCDSPYYRAFVKFGNYCVNTHVIAPARFMTWLLKAQKKIDHWCSDNVYTEYLIEYLRVEAVDDALARAIEHSIRWAEETGNPHMTGCDMATPIVYVMLSQPDVSPLGDL
jgi:hypothetical protein